MPAAPRVASPAPSIAPPVHTAALIALIVAVAVTGTLLSAGQSATPATGHGPIAAYVPLLVVEWSLLFYVCRVGRPSRSLTAYLGRRWDGWRRACGDMALALGTMALIEGMEWAWLSATGASRGASVAASIPATGMQRAAWLVVSGSVALCEEVVYRGYLQTQLAAATRRIGWGIALQAVLFGIAHADQGPAAAARVALYGAILGVLAHRRRSLIPGILAHTGIDLAAAFA